MTVRSASATLLTGRILVHESEVVLEYGPAISPSPSKTPRMSPGRHDAIGLLVSIGIAPNSRLWKRFLRGANDTPTTIPVSTAAVTSLRESKGRPRGLGHICD